MPRALVPVIAAALLAGCGNDRTPPPEVDRPADPRGERVERMKYGIIFRAPANWDELPEAGRRVGGIRSGRATVAVFRYARSQALPGSRAELHQVRELLLDAVGERDETFDLERSRLTRMAGAPAIVITGTQTLAGAKARVRSAHIFRFGAEYVVDAYAPPAEFERLDAAVFRPLMRSLRLREVR